MRSISACLIVLLLWYPLAWAAKKDVVIDADKTLALGKKEFAGQLVDDDATRCGVRVDRTNWKQKTATIRAWLELSLDGGRTWKEWIAVTGEGGEPPLGRDGKPVTDVFVESALPAGTGRLVRGGYDVQGAQFRTTVLVRCF